MRLRRALFLFEEETAACEFQIAYLKHGFKPISQLMILTLLALPAK
jgi:hypothetical protein